MMFKTQRTQRGATFSLSPQQGHAFSGVRPSSGAETGEPPAGQRIPSASNELHRSAVPAPTKRSLLSLTPRFSEVAHARREHPNRFNGFPHPPFATAHCHAQPKIRNPQSAIRNGLLLALLAFAPCSAFAQPANDNFTNATVITGSIGT